MISRLKKIISGSTDSARAILEGEFFSTNLQNQFTILQSLQSVLNRLEALEQNANISRDRMIEMTRQLNDMASTLGSRQSEICFKSEDDQNIPEESIIEFLFPRLQDKTVLDVGAHRGVFTDKMLRYGSSSVFAFEPHPELAELLVTKYKDDKRVRVISAAVSDNNGSAKLNLVRRDKRIDLNVDPLLFSSLKTHNMPEGLEFHGAIDVIVRNLQSLTDDTVIPKMAGLLKVDAEGNDLMVFKGMPKGRPYEILMSEFWSDDFVFATPGTPRHGEIFSFLRENGYGFSISILRTEQNTVLFQANRPVSRLQTWGNTLYFSDVILFDAAYGFVKNVIPQNL